jgi:hypothetical protein
MIVRLAEKPPLDRQQFVTQLAVSRGNDNLDGWPSVSNRLCQFQTVHASGHIDVGKHQPDFRMRVENIDGFVSIRRFKDYEAFVLE